MNVTVLIIGTTDLNATQMCYFNAILQKGTDFLMRHLESNEGLIIWNGDLTDDLRVWNWFNRHFPASHVVWTTGRVKGGDWSVRHLKMIWTDLQHDIPHSRLPHLDAVLFHLNGKIIKYDTKHDAWDFFSPLCGKSG